MGPSWGWAMTCAAGAVRDSRSWAILRLMHARSMQARLHALIGSNAHRLLKRTSRRFVRLLSWFGDPFEGFRGQ